MKKIFTLLYLLFIFSNSYGQTIRYVKPTGNNSSDSYATDQDQLSWEKASDDLQRMINKSADGDIIRLAVGTYKPNRLAQNSEILAGDIGSPIDLRDRAFVLKKNVKIYGGYDPDSPTSARNLIGTILSGQFSPGNIITSGSGENLTISNNENNAYHVVIAVGDLGNALLDGLVIEAANANNASSLLTNQAGQQNNKAYSVARNIGAGIYYQSSTNTRANITLREITLRHNFASNIGGGLYASASGINITNCKIEKNIALNGAAIMVRTAGYTVITGSTISDNRATNRGGGLAVNGCTSTVEKTLISGNYAAKDGGGIWNNNGGKIDVINSKILANKTTFNGAGIKNIEGSTLNIRNTLIADNMTTNGNYAGVFNKKGNFNAVNATIVKNGNKGFNNISSNITKNSIIGDIAGDTNADAGTGFSDPSGDVISDSITSSTVFVDSPSALTNLFTDATNGDYTLKETSAARNSGNNSKYDGTIATDKDLFGNKRLYESNIDQGAYEYRVDVLPVTIADFKIGKNLNSVKLNWTTATESNNRQFNLSRSFDGVTFKQIAIIPSKNQPATYTYVDLNVGNGTNYYKLEQVDLNGKLSYIDTKSINLDFNAHSVTAYPNPTTGLTNIAFKPGLFQRAQITNLLGRRIAEKHIESNTSAAVIDLSKHPKGIYFIKLIGQNDSHIVKVIKQ